MQKNINLCVDLKTVMQNVSILAEGTTYTGVLTRDSEDHFLFEESVKKAGCKRNPFIFYGKHCTLTHRKDGKYQINMRPINATAITDRNKFAMSVYNELLNAFEVLD